MRKLSSVFRCRVIKFFAISFACLSALILLSNFLQETRTHAQDEIIAPITFSNAAPITIAAAGAANPYPSAINVSNVIGAIDKVTIKLNNFGHTFPSDVDILLVGPTGQNATIMSDVGSGGDVNGITLTFDDAAMNSLSTTTLVSGIFKPTNLAGGDPFPQPAPVPTGGSVLSVFHQTNPNGVWRLFVVDDTGMDGGTIAGGWELNFTIANQFENPAPITFPSSGSANPYPSSVTTANLAGNVVKAQVKLNNFSHTSPDDVDILLVSPSGRSIVLMSDVGGANPVNNLTLTFDDTAPGFLPDDAPLATGIYKPTDFEPGDAFPAPAPQGAPSGNKLGAFFNDQAVGEWKLYAVDDAGNNTGSISAGWLIIIDSSPTAISIPSVGVSDPYPSEISISGQTGMVSKVVVGVQNFNHAAPDDVDLMLVSPSGRKVVLMSDVGGNTEVGGLNLTFDDGAAATLPDNSALASGNYRPTDFEPGDIFPFPAPSGAATGRMLSVLNGSEPNGLWKLFLVDDNGENVGIIAGWTLNVQTSETGIAIPAVGIAEPYPSNLAITDQQGSVIKVAVTLNNFSHTAPDDADLMLVAPNGRRIVLMSDVGGNTEVGGLNLIFDDAASENLPDNAPLTSGTFKPTDFEPGEAFPAPAPSGVTGTTLNAFYGSAANGVWKLYVVDDTGENPGSIAGSWSLNIQSSVSACLFNLSSSVQAFPMGGGSGSFGVQIPVGCPWTASSSANFINLTAGSSGEGDGSISFTVAPNMGPARTGTITVTNGAFSRTFQIQQASGCPFSINQTVLNFSSAGGNGNVAVSASPECSWQAASNVSWISVDSMPHSGNGSVIFNVQPNTTPNVRSGIITVGSQSVTVNQTGTAAALSAKRFDYDGDGKADLSVFRPSAGSWYLSRSSDSAFIGVQFGASGDLIAPADFDGDGKTDISVFRPSDGGWYRLNSSNSTFSAFQFGTNGDLPAPGDFDGDGKADLTVYRPSTGSWYRINSSTNQFIAAQFGITEDKPLIADFDGDGKSDLAVFRLSNGTWYRINSSNDTFSPTQFGTTGDLPVPADYDGDGKTDLAVYRPSAGDWHIVNSSNSAFISTHFGISEDKPAPADYDGDGKTDFAVFRPSLGTWYLLQTTAGFTGFQFGATGDIPTPNAYIR